MIIIAAKKQIKQKIKKKEIEEKRIGKEDRWIERGCAREEEKRFIILIKNKEG